MDGLGACPPVLQDSIKIRLLHIKTRHRVIQHAFQSLQIRASVPGRHHFHNSLPAVAIGFYHLRHLRIGGFGNQHAGAFSFPAHENTLCRSGCAVINRSVGSVQACQFTDHRLIFENRLKQPLADFRLIRRIGGDKFLLRNNLLYNRRNIMIISARAPENMAEDTVFLRIVFHFPGSSQL